MRAKTISGRSRTTLGLRGASFVAPADLTDEASIDGACRRDRQALGRGRHPGQQRRRLSQRLPARHLDGRVRPHLRDQPARAIHPDAWGSRRRWCAGREGLDHQHLVRRLAQDAPTVVPYCTSKTALDRLTKGFAVELAEYRHPRQRAGARLRRRQHGQRPDRGAYPEHGRRRSRWAGRPRGKMSATGCSISPATPRPTSPARR